MVAENYCFLPVTCIEPQRDDRASGVTQVAPLFYVHMFDFIRSQIINMDDAGDGNIGTQRGTQSRGDSVFDNMVFMPIRFM